MIGSLLKVKVDSNLSHECASINKHARSGNARGALLSLLILALACLGSVKANAQDWKGSTVDKAKDKTVYLWNVGAKKFLGKGGRWGTEAIISNVGTPFKVVEVTSGKTYRLESIVKAQENGEQSETTTTTNGALGFMNGKNSEHDKGNFFVDRSDVDDKTYGTRDFTFTSYSESSCQLTVTSKNGESDYTGTFYLFANMAGDGDIKKAKGVKTVNKDSTDYSKWIIVTEDERREYFKDAEASSTTSVPGTFLMFDNGFDRNDNNVQYWETKKSSSSVSFDGKLSWSGNTESVKPSKQTAIYYNGNGYSINEVKVDVDEDGNELSDKSTPQQELYGGDWTANIHGSYGVVNQTIPTKNMVREGWYKVSCVGFTTATKGTVELYASAGTASTEGKEYAVKALKKINDSDAPATYVKASRLINGNGYEASVMVYVGKDGGSYKTLSFGILVDGADDKAWTCFDSFQIEYFGNPTANLVLDEDQIGIKYINNQRKVKNAAGAEENYAGQRVLYLHRTFNLGKWNCIVLPVNLTVSQVKTAFGENVRISEFKGAIDENHKGRIIFEKIGVSRDDDKATAIEAGKLYLIKPDEGAKMDSKDGKVTATGDNSVSVTDYYTIPQVEFNPEKDIEARVEGEKGAETYGSTVQVQFVGTYVSDDKNEKSIPANSYVLAGKDTENAKAGDWYYRTVSTFTKGFRGWLQPVGDNSNAKQLEYSVDGEVHYADYNTTGIQGIVDDLNARESNIYNLNGQLVRANATSRDGLAKGVYVQNGKKFIVK